MTTDFGQWIAIVEPSASWLPLSDTERARVLSLDGLTGLDIRIRPGAEIVARDCVQAGLPYRLHSWEGGRDATNLPANWDAAEGARDAARVGARRKQIATAAGAPAEGYGLNDERDAWKQNPTAVDALDAFADRYLELTTERPDHLGFWDPAWHYGARDWDGDGDIDTKIPDASKAKFRRKHVMAYQRLYPQIVGTLTRARKVWPTHPMGAYVSIGALAPDGDIIGRPDAIQRVCVERVAGIDEVTHYVGLPESWVRMLMRGNAKVAPLVERIPQIAAACRAGAMP